MDADLLAHLQRIEQKLDLVITNTLSNAPPSARDLGGIGILTRMTPKQHAVCQMLVAAVPNVGIAKALGIKENSAKVHVRAMAKKFGFQRREQTAIRYREIMAAMSEEEYQAVSGGIEKNWWPGGAERGDHAALLAPDHRRMGKKTKKGS